MRIKLSNENSVDEKGSISRKLIENGFIVCFA